MNNDELVALFKDKVNLRRRVSRAKAAAEKAAKRYADLKDQLNSVKSMNCVIDGVAVYMDENGVIGVAPENRRYAVIFMNRKNGGETYGLRTRNREPSIWAPDRFQSEQFHGSGWPSHRSAQDAAIAWVTKGIRPPFRDEEPASKLSE